MGTILDNIKSDRGRKMSCIYHPTRKKLDISLLEYCIADMINDLSGHNALSKGDPWCYASRKYMAKVFDVSESSIKRAIKNLIEKKIIRKPVGCNKTDCRLQATGVFHEEMRLKEEDLVRSK